jgi:hypothetical protein
MYSQPLSTDGCRSQPGRVRGVGWVREGGHAGEVRDRLLQKFHLFGNQFGSEITQAGDVGAWSGQASNESYAHGIGWGDRDDGDGARPVLGREGTFRRLHDYDVHFAPNQLGYHLWQPLGLELGESGREDEIPSLDPTMLLQAPVERGSVRSPE